MEHSHSSANIVHTLKNPKNTRIFDIVVLNIRAIQTELSWIFRGREILSNENQHDLFSVFI